MKKTSILLSVALNSVIALGSAAAAVSLPKQALADDKIVEIAADIIRHGEGCVVLDAVNGMDRQHTIEVLNAIATAGQTLSVGSMAVTTMDGDPDNVVVALNFVNQKTKGPNQVLLYTIFSKAHPVVDGLNTACSY